MVLNSIRRFLPALGLLWAGAALAPLAKAQLSASPNSLSFFDGINSSDSQGFSVTNGGKAVTVSLGATSSPTNWLNVSPGILKLGAKGSGSETQGASALVNTAGLAPNPSGPPYMGQIVIQDGMGHSAIVTVSLTVNGAVVTLTAAPSSVTISVAAGKTASGTPIKITVTGGTATVVATPNGTGLSVASSGNTFTPMVDATSLTTSQQDAVIFSCSGSVFCTPIAVGVTINVQASSSAPVINSFTAGPQAINAGDATLLAWNVTNASSVIIDNGVGPVPASGSQAVRPSTTTTYTLTATNASGSSSQPITVVVNAASTTVTKIIPQVVDGGPWQSTIVVVNRGPNPVTVSLSFSMQTTADGATAPWALQMVGNFNYSQIQLAPHSAVWMRTQDAGSNVVQGFATLTGSIDTEAFGIFKQQVPGRQDQEGTATASTAGTSVVVPFDNAEQNVTTMALVNSGSSSQTINVTFLSTSGMSSMGSLVIPAGGHTAFSTLTQFPALTGLRGVAVFSSSGAPFTALAFRFNSTGAFTTIPVFSGAASAALTTILSQIADGGPWTTTIVLVNTGAATVQVQISFQQDTPGGNSAPWSPSLNGQVVQSVSIPAGGAVFLETPGTATNVTTGYATVNGPAGIQAFAIFKQRIAGRQDQEGTAAAFAPAQEVLVPFDNTSGNVTTAALVNTGQTQTFNAQYQGSTQVQVNGGAHTAFALTAQIPASSNALSLADFTSSASAFSMLALRFNSTGAFTSIPVFPAASQ